MSQPSLNVRPPFSASEAAFEGFRILRRRPSTLLVWSGLMLVFGLVTQGGMLFFIGPQMAALQTLGKTPGATPDPAAFAGLFAAMGPFYALLMVAFILLFGVISAAANRAVLRPNEGGPGYLALGADELLQIAVMFILGIIAFVAYIVVVIVVVLLVTVGVGIAVAAKGGGAGWIVGLVVALAIIAVFCAFVWAAVRLSLALPLTFDTRQIHIFQSFALTKGRFWPLFGAYFLTWIFTLLITLVYLVIFFAVIAAVGGGLAAMGQVFRPAAGAGLVALFTPVALVSLVGGAIVQAIQWALLAGAQANAYAQLRPNRLAEVF